MTTWHLLGTREELAARRPLRAAARAPPDRAVPPRGALPRIGNACNHKGGPLCEGRVRGEYVTCPWHGWEYSVVTGRGPAGYDEEQVPVFEVEERSDGVHLATPPASPRKLIEHKPSHLLQEHPKPAGAPPRVLGLSTTAMDEGNPRFSTSDVLLEHALAHAASALAAETQLLRLRELRFRPCEGNYWSRPRSAGAQPPRSTSRWRSA